MRGMKKKKKECKEQQHLTFSLGVMFVARFSVIYQFILKSFSHEQSVGCSKKKVK
jgi:hypothetical protein